MTRALVATLLGTAGASCDASTRRPATDDQRVAAGSLAGLGAASPEALAERAFQTIRSRDRAALEALYAPAATTKRICARADEGAIARLVRDLVARLDACAPRLSPDAEWLGVETVHDREYDAIDSTCDGLRTWAPHALLVHARDRGRHVVVRLGAPHSFEGAGWFLQAAPECERVERAVPGPLFEALAQSLGTATEAADQFRALTIDAPWWMAHCEGHNLDRWHWSVGERQAGAKLDAMHAACSALLDPRDVHLVRVEAGPTVPYDRCRGMSRMGPVEATFASRGRRVAMRVEHLLVEATGFGPRLSFLDVPVCFAAADAGSAAPSSSASADANSVAPSNSASADANPVAPSNSASADASPAGP